MVAGTSKLATLPVSLPTVPLPDNVDAKQVAKHFQDILERITEPETFATDAVWRDTFALTGTLRTFYSADGISRAWQAASIESASPKIGSLVIDEGAAKVTALPSGNSWIDISGTFQVKTFAGLECNCTLMINAVPALTGTGWRIWAMRTILDAVDGWSSVDHYTPPILDDDIVHTSTNGAHAPYFDVVVVGGGQSGLSTAGRLQALGIKYVVIDGYKRIGDSWASRYDSARLHTSREYAHLPFDRTFPDDKYQEFLTKDDLARGYRDWCAKFGVDRHVWTECRLQAGSWDDQSLQWTLEIKREGRQATINSRFVVMASGGGCQIPWMPDLPGKADYQGITLHSQHYKSSKDWSGLNAIVVGSGNTAHDIVEDMHQAGLASTTMIQRSKTYVLPYEYWQTISSRLYNAQIPTFQADKIQMTGPNAIGRLMAMGGLTAMAQMEPERFEALEKAGFLTEPYGDIFWHLLERGGGHYMDIGTSQKIADGKARLSKPFMLRTSTDCACKDQDKIWSDSYTLHHYRLGLQQWH